MRLGVSGKIFIAYTALAAVFVASSGLTLVYMHRARARVLASQVLFDVQSDLDETWRRLADFPAAPTRRPDPLRSLAFEQARDKLSQALVSIDDYLGQRAAEQGLPDFRKHRREIVGMQLRMAQVAARLGAFEIGRDEKERQAFMSRFANLTYALQKKKRAIGDESRGIAAQLRADEENARNLAVFIAAFGLLVAFAVAFSMLRTLRPLLVLRQQARAVAGGDYARRVAINSRDEIGDLAREFDAMAVAVDERERRLVAAERLATIGQMAAHITHEIRNPLASIGLNAELLADEMGPVGANQEARRLLASICAEVDRLSEITDTYLRFVRLPRPDRAREDIGAIVTSVLEFSRAELAQSGVALAIDIGPDVPEVAADENQIRQAVLNLVRNAKEAMDTAAVPGSPPEPGARRLGVAIRRTDKGEAQVEIADSGPGIDAVILSKIFDPFFSTKKKGTGLGLPLVQQIIAEHGGRIWARNLSGGGCCFTFVLPPWQLETAPGESAPEPAGSAGASAEPAADGAVAPLHS